MFAGSSCLFQIDVHALYSLESGVQLVLSNSTILSLENERSPLQLVSTQITSQICKRKIQVHYPKASE